MTTTISSTATPTPSASSVVSAAAQSLLTSLDTGSGVDTTSLVTALVQAQFASRNDALAKKSDTLTAQISGLGAMKSAISGFATALASLVKGGTLTAQPTSSNPGILTATALPGAKLSALSSAITVSQLATAQTASSATAIDRTVALGTGTLTLNVGTASYDDDGVMTVAGGSSTSIEIVDGASSLDAIAVAINAAKKGVTAAIVTDADGKAFLSLKGATGTAQAFTLEAADPASGLASLNVGGSAPAMTITGEAQNAKLKVDGVSVERATNVVSDLIDGVKLQLTGVSPVAVQLGSTPPTAALDQSVHDFVDTYNQVLAIVTEQTDPINGPLRSDTNAKALLQSLKGLTLATILPGAAAGTPSTLSEIGIATNRDGTLSVNDTTLTGALTKWPDSVEAMFAPSTDGSGISAILTKLADAETDTRSKVGLVAAETTYTNAQKELAIDQDDVAVDTEAMTTRLTQQYASMNARVASYKSVQAFLKNQVDAWNKSDS